LAYHDVSLNAANPEKLLDRQIFFTDLDDFFTLLANTINHAGDPHEKFIDFSGD